MALKATPMTTATARSMMLPRIRNFLKPPMSALHLLRSTKALFLRKSTLSSAPRSHRATAGIRGAGVTLLTDPGCLTYRGRLWSVIGRHLCCRGDQGFCIVSLDVTVRGIKIPPEELTWRFSRSPGPGGQSVNTTDSQAELSFDLMGSVALPPDLRDRALAALAGRLSDG